MTPAISKLVEFYDAQDSELLFNVVPVAFYCSTADMQFRSDVRASGFNE